MHKVTYTSNARKDLKSIEKGIADRIIKKIYNYSEQGNPLRYALKVKTPSIGEYRFRVGNYRVFFDVNRKGEIKILLILRIKHRREAYS